MKKLVISLPTRGRPQQLIETIRKSTSNLVLPNTVFMVQADEDDKLTVETLQEIPLDKRVMVTIEKREDTIAEKWNRAMRIPADLYLVDADDAPFVTPGYDAKLLEAATRFPDGIGMVYGHMANLSFTGVMAPTAKFVDKLGHIFPELFPYWFVDHWTDDIARIIGRISFADVRTDQSRVGKTQEFREVAWWATFFDACYLRRRRIAHKIIEDKGFTAPYWLKEILLNHHPLIEQRSRILNSSVRAEAPKLERWFGVERNERYERVKQRAVDMVPGILAEMLEDEAAMFRSVLVPPKNVVGLKQAFA